MGDVKVKTETANAAAPSSEPGKVRLEDYVRSHRKRFLALVAALHEKGVKFKLSTNISAFVQVEAPIAAEEDWQEKISASTTLLLMDFWNAGFKAYRNQSIGFSGELSPDEGLEIDSQTAMETDAALLGQTAVALRPYAIYITGKPGDYRITLWDWFEERPFFDKRYSVLNPYDLSHEEIGKIVEAHARHMGGMSMERIRSAISEAASEELPAPVTSASPAADWNRGRVEHAQNSWLRLGQFFNVGIAARPIGSAVDRGEQRKYTALAEDQTIMLDDDVIEKAGAGAMQIRGALDYVFLELRPDQEYDRALTEKCLSEEKMQDRYGNIIIPVTETRSESWKNGGSYGGRFWSVCKGFLVTPSIPLERVTTAGGTWTFGVDLSELGLGNYPALAAVESPPVIDTKAADSPYQLFSTLPEPNESWYTETFSHMSDEIALFERDFGLEPGDRIKNIFYVPALSSNAFAMEHNSDTIFVHDDMLQKFEDPKRLRAVTRHEAAHCLDFQLVLSEGTPIEDFFVEMKEGVEILFFDDVNESIFWDLADAGHSQDNENELLASLVTSVDAPEWESKVKGMMDDDRKRYLRGLEALRSSLVQKYPSTAELLCTPFYGRLSARIDALKSADL